MRESLGTGEVEARVAEVQAGLNTLIGAAADVAGEFRPHSA